MNMSVESHRKCYVCNNFIESSIDFEINKVFESTTLHSQTPIHILLERFVGQSLSSRIEPNGSDALCQQCINKFDEYDLAVITAERVQNELLQCFNDTITKYDELEIKYENVVAEQQECIEFDPLNYDGEGSIVIKSEKEDSYDDCSYQDGDYAYDEFNLRGSKKRIRKKKRKIETDIEADDDDDENRRLVELKMPSLLFKCQQCQFEFENETDFKVHQRSHDAESNEIHVCGICGQTYKSKTALDIHVGLHKGVSTHVCEVCYKIFTQKEALAQHMPIHSREQQYQEMKSNRLHNFVAPMDVARERTNEPIEIDDTYDVLPSKSKSRYQQVYNDFKKWQTLKKDRSISETVLLAYFHELAGKNKPPSLWAYHSMLKTTIRVNDNVDIGAFTQITAYLKSQSSGYKPVRSKIFTEREIQTFIDEASDDIWLDVKVVCIFGISGALNVDELVHIKVEDIEHHGKLLLVRVPKTKTKDRSFTITGKFYTIVQKYAALRHPDMRDNRFFVNYQRGKCTNQVIGKNKFSRMPRRIATYLQLPEPERYTGQSFRKSSKTILTNTSSWRLTKVSQEYIEDSDEINI